MNHKPELDTVAGGAVKLTQLWMICLGDPFTGKNLIIRINLELLLKRP